MEAFAKIDLGREPVPDETTICKFRHLLERHGLGPALLAEVNAYLAENGLKAGRGTIVDGTIIAAPHVGMDSRLKIRGPAPAAADFTHHHSARRNGLSKRDQEIHHTKGRVRARVEDAFHAIKRTFGFVKVRP